MKKIILTIISMTAALSPAAGHASGLVPVGCSLRNNGHVYTFLMEDYDFDCNIGVIDNSVATVYCEGQPVATGNFWVGNAHGQNPSGYVRIFFDPFLSPPKGKTYSLVVPAGVIYKEDDPTVTNDELSVDFYVPEVLGFRRCSMQNSSVVDLEACIGFYYETGTARAENGEIILYRKDVPIKKDPVRAGYNYDSGLGYAEMSFGGGVHFESGVEYTVRLPQGSLTAEFRSDITNEEVSVSFTGGSTVPFGPLMYNGCSLSDSQPSDMLGEVKFYYEKPLSFWLRVNPAVQLYNETDGVVVKEAVPVLSVEKKRNVVTVDFGNTPLVPEKEYSIIIPEATVVAVKGKSGWGDTPYLIVNQCNTVPLVNNSGVSEIGYTDCDINVENGTVTIDGTSAGAPVTLLSLDGKVLYNAKSNGGTVSIPVGTTGIYLLSVNGKTHKIAVGK